jgi:hypothetical protein
LDNNDITAALQSEFSMSEQECQRYAKLAVGNYVTALEIVGQGEERQFFFDKFIGMIDWPTHVSFLN